MREFLRSNKGISRTVIAIVVVVLIAIAGIGAYMLTKPPVEKKRKLGIIFDIGGRGDLSFNDMAAMGGEMAKEQLGYEVTEVTSATEADYLPNLRSLAQTGEYDLIVAVGFLMTDAVRTVADEFPEQKFAIIDGYIPDKPNVLSILFEEHEGSALVGALAGLLAAYYGYPHVGMALGIEIPVLWKFEIGYKWGVDWAMKWYEEKFGTKPPVIGETPPKERVLWVYTGTFSDPTKGYEAAKTQFEQGAVCVYNVGGPIGLGIFRAAEEICVAQGKTMGPPFGIGVDADQDWIRPGFIIASMMKRVDIGVFTAAKLVKEGKFEGGVLTLGLKDRGVAISRLEDLDAFLRMGIEAGTIKPEDRDRIYEKVKAMRESIPDWIWEAVEELERQILEGKVVVPKPLTEEDIEYYRSIYG